MAHLPETKRDFLLAVKRYGTVKRACKETGIARSVAYTWMEDPNFEATVQASRAMHREAIAEDLVEKASAACGHVYWVPVTDENGHQLMEEVVDEGTGEVSLRPAFRRELRHHDSRIMSKMLDKFLDGPVQRNDNRNLNADVSLETAAARSVRVKIVDADGEELGG